MALYRPVNFGQDDSADSADVVAAAETTATAASADSRPALYQDIVNEIATAQEAIDTSITSWQISPSNQILSWDFWVFGMSQQSQGTSLSDLQTSNDQLSAVLQEMGAVLVQNPDAVYVAGSIYPWMSTPLAATDARVGQPIDADFASGAAMFLSNIQTLISLVGSQTATGESEAFVQNFPASLKKLLGLISEAAQNAAAAILPSLGSLIPWYVWAGGAAIVALLIYLELRKKA